MPLHGPPGRHFTIIRSPVIASDHGSDAISRSCGDRLQCCLALGGPKGYAIDKGWPKTYNRGLGSSLTAGLNWPAGHALTIIQTRL